MPIRDDLTPDQQKIMASEMYFESEETKQQYINMPKNEAHAQLGNATDDGEAEG